MVAAKLIRPAPARKPKSLKLFERKPDKGYDSLTPSLITIETGPK